MPRPGPGACARAPHNAPPALPPASRRAQGVWLAQLELLASLPYPAATLVPAIVAAVRSGIAADAGAFGWVEGEQLRPVAFWSERMSEDVFRAFNAHLGEFFDTVPLRAQLVSDGGAIRSCQDMAGYRSHWHLPEILAPLGTRWATGVPVLDHGGACTGFLYLYRNAEAGRFSDSEQARLRRARDRLRSLTRQPAQMPAPCALRPARLASLQFAPDGQLVARSAQAIELLCLCHEARLGLMDWAARDLHVLPESPRRLLGQHLAQPTAPAATTCTLVNAAGRFDFRIERLQRLDGGTAQTVVTVQNWEPVDITVARRLTDWPLSPQEKRLVVASARGLDHKAIAEQLGITVGTLKAYVNRLKAKLGADSRQAIVQRLLADCPK